MSKRSYGQNCALAIALDLIGERWTMLIVRELLLSPKRFGELLENLPGIGTNLLADRLKRMSDQGLLEKHGDHSSRNAAYRLTASGELLSDTVQSLIRWGMRFSDLRANTQHRRAEWNLLALRAYVDLDAATAWRGIYRLCLDDQVLLLTFSDGQLQSPQEEPSDIVGEIRMTSEQAAKIASGDANVPDALRSGAVKTIGEQEDIERFFAAFSG